MKTRSIYSRIIIMAIAITFSTFSAVTLVQAAGTNYIDNKISKSELKGKCARSGGTFEQDEDGYGCIVNYDDGSSTTVSCDNDEKCIGGTTDAEKERPNVSVMIQLQALNLQATQLAPVPVAPTVPVIPQLMMVPMQFTTVLR